MGLLSGSSHTVLYCIYCKAVSREDADRKLAKEMLQYKSLESLMLSGYAATAATCGSGSLRESLTDAHNISVKRFLGQTRRMSKKLGINKLKDI